MNKYIAYGILLLFGIINLIERDYKYIYFLLFILLLCVISQKKYWYLKYYSQSSFKSKFSDKLYEDHLLSKSNAESNNKYYYYLLDMLKKAKIKFTEDKQYSFGIKNPSKMIKIILMLLIITITVLVYVYYNRFLKVMPFIWLLIYFLFFRDRARLYRLVITNECIIIGKNIYLLEDIDSLKFHANFYGKHKYIYLNVLTKTKNYNSHLISFCDWYHVEIFTLLTYCIINNKLDVISSMNLYSFIEIRNECHSLY